jgi:hypothetical protein
MQTGEDLLNIVETNYNSGQLEQLHRHLLHNQQFQRAEID